MDVSNIQHILDAYQLGQISSAEFLGNAGGFSGARLWRIDSDRGDFCLRRWPKNSAVNLAAIHQTLLVAHQAGLPVAAPILGLGQQTITLDAEQASWELAYWMPGSADFNLRPSRVRLEDAVKTLSQFHTVTTVREVLGPSPGLQSRFKLMKGAPQMSELIRQAIAGSPSQIAPMAVGLLPRLERYFKPLTHRLGNVVDRPWRLVNAIRDIHHDHVFFSGDQLSGIVDFGAMKTEARCFDLARLVGSLKMDGECPWAEAFQIYSALQEFDPGETDLIRLVHECNLVLGSLNWLSWIFVESRQFEDWSAVQARIEQLSEQLVG